MTTLNATPATVQAQMKAAQPGDALKLEPGDYGHLLFKAVVKAEPGVEVLGAGATLASLFLTGCEGIAVRGVTMKSEVTQAVKVYTSKRILIEAFDLSGVPLTTACLWARWNEDLIIQGCRFHDARHGIFHEGNVRLVIRGNDFRDLHGDGMRGGLNSDGVLIEDNSGTDLHLQGADHLDFIQFWTTAATKPTRNVTIRRNHYFRGAGSPAQGILMGDEAGVGYENLLIEDNVIVGSLYNGISVSGGRMPVVQRNYVQPMDGGFDAKGKAVDKAWIMFRGSDGGQSIDNFASLFQSYQNVTEPTNTGFTPVPMAQDGDYAAARTWMARNDAPSAPADTLDALIADLKAQLAAEAEDDAALDARALEAETRAAGLEAELKAAKASREIVSADRDDDRAALIAIQSAAASALASFPA
ncbi:MAG: right-handed parallel beta-helix repeat-containing protein [Phenylobacterium sp.]|uniref:right-handed parallel beta-helix repeat-containing protein n=1 Tax=Phenylobacterium sp. TaxID=1871053 RepID=UPI001A356F21|nr:right-handed parallel beta-helix repeat-containing protein [Phenylobacterium sp.]MBJ7410114.1 right-handed parallel beta-helix repeat-containing protein [Phenylobacterium sp.]